MSIRAILPGRVQLGGLIALLAVVMAGCADPDPEPTSTRPGKSKETLISMGKKVNVGQNIWLEVAGGKRRVLVSAEVCLRQGQLEQFMTRKNRKEHEAIVTADIDARKLHEALLLTGADPGSPVQFTPRYRPPTGPQIQVSVRYKEKGATKEVSARSWIRNAKTKKELETDWVFAGSLLVENPIDKTGPKQYLANDGDVICVSNFETALLDLPIQSSKDNDDRSYEAWTERIPRVGTKVVVVLEPVGAGGK